MRPNLEGRTVNVYFDNVEVEYCVYVEHVPQATGDSWYLRRHDGTWVIVSSFAKMVVMEDIPEEK